MSCSGQGERIGEVGEGRERGDRCRGVGRGYMYETPDQKEPVFDAKGIETVRRDSCPAVAKVRRRERGGERGGERADQCRG